MAEPLKNSYNRAYITRLAKALKQHHPKFDSKAFSKAVFDKQWQERELKARMSHIRGCIYDCLDLPYEDALTVLLPAAESFGGYEAMFFPEYVEVYGQGHWDASMQALEVLTQYSSSEFAVRPFIEMDTQRMMGQMMSWAQHDNEHVRRLASEGCRPRLPWAKALPAFKQDPALIVPVLTQLRCDPSLYVRRSVANNLNDIAKDNPEVTLDWMQQYFGDNELTDWIIKHGCRTLLKQAHPEALSLFGYGDVSAIKVASFTVDTPSLREGEDLAFSFDIKRRGGELGKLRIEYGIDYQKANGSLSRKVFKVAEGQYNASNLSFQRRQSFRPMTTRKHYPGTHRVALLVNGVELALEEFELAAVGQ
ncbi:DNA alkylation repair protein [Maricurvus nonylphenolicus]|uniref:hypothetical protein n=1 Tax=Maricurvus nonylphenolicus TaxID=1008307 RepID=UPI0036F3008C